VGLWFQRLPSRIDTDAAGRHWLIVDYQVINSPLMPVSVALPALALDTAAGVPLKVDGWPIHLSPLTAKPAYANIEPLPLRPDRLPAPLPTRDLKRQLLLWSVGLGAVLCAWWVGFLWAERRDALRQPFARALRQLRDEDDAGAWICVHRALNETAGRVIQAGTLDQLFLAAPQLEPLRPALQDFYRQSSERFFARAAPGTPFPLRDLCRQLRRIEKRTSRGRAVRS
jgi:mxaA protein